MRKKTRSKQKVKVVTLPLLLAFRSVPYFCLFTVELERKVAEAVSAADALTPRSLNARH
jgi:hypothetical protein